MEKKKYYILINALWGGGAERAATNLANQMNKSWYEVFLITILNKLFYKYDEGVRYMPLTGFTKGYMLMFGFPYYYWKFKQILRKYNLKEGMSFLQASNFLNLLTVKNATISYRVHVTLLKFPHNLYSERILGRLQIIGIFLFYRFAKKIIVSSQENKNDLSDYFYIDKNKIEVLYNKIDKMRIEKLRYETVEEDLDISPGMKVFITVSKVEKEKWHIKIIEALGKVYQSLDKNRKYIIVWGGSEIPYLQKLCEKYEINEHVIFVGEQKNVFKYLNLADIFLYSSYTESIPNVLLEAKGMQIPIITTNFKVGAQEVVIGDYQKDRILDYPLKGEYGYLVDPDNFTDNFIQIYNSYVLKK